MSIHLNTAVSRRRFLEGAAVFSCFPSLSSLGAGAESETWAFLSDTHIHADPGFVSRNETNLAENLRRVVAEVMAERDSLAGVLIDGDCAFNVGLRGDYELLAELIAPLVESKLPVHLTMGNHDDRGPFFETFTDRRPEASPVESKHVALVESAVANFVFLDSLRFVNKVEGEFGETQLAWLDRVLAANPDKPAILVGHHYPQAAPADGAPADKPVKISGLVDTDPFLELVAKRPQAKVYVYGHSHNWSLGTDDNGFHRVNLPPTAYVFDVARPNGWVRARISPTGMTLELSALDKSHPEHGKVKTLAWR